MSIVMHSPVLITIYVTYTVQVIRNTTHDLVIITHDSVIITWPVASHPQIRVNVGVSEGWFEILFYGIWGWDCDGTRPSVKYIVKAKKINFSCEI